MKKTLDKILDSLSIFRSDAKGALCAMGFAVLFAGITYKVPIWPLVVFTLGMYVAYVALSTISLSFELKKDKVELEKERERLRAGAVDQHPTSVETVVTDVDDDSDEDGDSDVVPKRV